jgi:hypothetical protein
MTSTLTLQRPAFWTRAAYTIVIAGLCFVGVGLRPANLALPAHESFTLYGFGAFLVATVLYSIVILRAPDYPNRYAWPFVIFAGLLAAHLWLLTNGPGGSSATAIQATGQKIIVYASVGSILLQAILARRVVAT